MFGISEPQRIWNEVQKFLKLRSPNSIFGLDLKNAEKITDEKIIDFYIWQFSKMMKDSKQMNGNGFRKKIRYE